MALIQGRQGLWGESGLYIYTRYDKAGKEDSCIFACMSKDYTKNIKKSDNIDYSRREMSCLRKRRKDFIYTFKIICWSYMITFSL